MTSFPDLTVKQDKFVREYVKTGNGTQAAIKAGYSPATSYSIASENLKKPEVEEAVLKLRQRLAERLDISREKLINDIAHIAEQSHIQGEFGAAIKANELILKAQGYLVERSLNMNVDVTQQHLDALQTYTDRRIDERMEERIAQVNGEAVIVENHARTPVSDENVCTHSGAQHKNNDRSMDVMEHPTHVDDQ